MMADLPAGPELDRLLCDRLEINPVCFTIDNIYPRPSTTWHGMGLVIEAMEKRGWWCQMNTPVEPGRLDSKYFLFCQGVFQKHGVSGHPDFRASGSTIPHAVCLAALAALENEE